MVKWILKMFWGLNKVVNWSGVDEWLAQNLCYNVRYFGDVVRHGWKDRWIHVENERMKNQSGDKQIFLWVRSL